MTVRDKIAGFLRGGQDRRAWLEDQNTALMSYVPPELRAWAQLGAEANPVVSMERAGIAANKARTSQGWDRVAALGDVASNVAGVVAPVAAAKGVGMPAAQAIEEALLGVSAQPRAAAGHFAMDESGALRLFHGSPHDFDRFSMDKIGTGEGAQAYGHGLYFAESEDVAREYRDALRFPRIDGAVTPIERVADDLNYHRGNVDGVRQIYKDMIARGTPEAQAMAREKLEALPDAVDRFKGRLYEVNVDANPDDFLDWDKPLSEQPQKVRDAIIAQQTGDDPLLAELFGSGMSAEDNMLLGMMPNAQGAAAYKTIANSVGGEDAAAYVLRKRGIPGIRYLDAGSRGAGDGSRNYVVFDENLITIVKKYGIGGAAAVYGVSEADIANAMGMDAQTGQPVNAWTGLSPFDAAKHKPRSNPDGSFSTEIEITNDSPDGRFWNIPTLWYSPDGTPRELPPEAAQSLAKRYEEVTGNKFPRFNSIEQAVDFAKQRSANGGATHSTLAQPEGLDARTGQPVYQPPPRMK